MMKAIHKFYMERKVIISDKYMNTNCKSYQLIFGMISTNLTASLMQN